MKIKSKRLMALILSVAMVLGMAATHAYAGEAGYAQTKEDGLTEPLRTEAVSEVNVGNTEITGNNVLLRKTAIASSTKNNKGPELVVDGVTTQTDQWNSEDMKTAVATDNSKDEEAQTEQWLQIDRGEGAQPIDIQAIKMWYNVKVWPMEYKILTAAESSLASNTPATNVNLDEWTEVVAVSRPSSNGWVANGPDQNIADTTANTDTITASTTPALQDVQLERYVLIYFSKVNAQAGGHNVNLREIEIFDTTVNVNVESILNGITADSATIEDGKVKFSAGGQAGVNISVRGSTHENVVDNEGNVVGYNIGERDVTLIVRAANASNADSFAEKNITVTIPDNRSAYDAKFNLGEASVNPEPEVIPSLQEWHGYTGDFQLTESSKIIYNDTASKGIDKVAEHMKADLLEITGLELTVSEGDGPTSPHDIYIESQATDTYGVGEEGYLLVTNDEGIHIYAPSYTGCLYGTITVEQILYLAKDNRTVPKGMTRDYPAYEVRGVMLDIARTPYRFSQLKDYTKIMLWYKMNEFHLHVNDNDNTNSDFATEETHMGFHRLESENFPSLKSEVKQVGPPAEFINKDYYLNNADYQGNPHYTKEQWRELSALCEDNGMYLLTEIDLPGHSLLYNKYAKDNPDNIDWLAGGVHYTANRLSNKGGLELMALDGDNAERAKRFAETLWEEYTQGPDPFISGDIVHIGADEYWDHNSALYDSFARFADSMRQVIQRNLGDQTKIRMWGAGTGMFSTAKTVLTGVDLPANYQLDLWYTSYDNPKLRLQEGYGVVNCRDAFVYGNPGRDNRDVPNAEYLFNDWSPVNFGGNTNPLEGEPGLLGTKAVFWGDQSVEGMTEADVHQRVLRGMAIISEKTWDGTDEEDTFQEYELRASRLGEGPGTQIAMEIDSKSALVLDYDFANLSEDGMTVYDTSGNGYHAALSGAGTVSEDGFLTFEGGKMTTPLKTLSYPYSVAFDLRISAEEGARNNTASSIFSGYDGQLQVAGNTDGDLLANVNYFTRNFDYQVPKDGTTVQIMLVGTFQGTKLYVNGALQTFLSQASSMDGLRPNSITSIASSFPLPLEKIGEGLHGQMARLQVYNQAFSAEEVAAYYNDGSEDVTRKVNVAQNTHAGGDSYRTGDPFDNGEQRISVAFKAIDGDAFTLKEDLTTQMDQATSERASYWKGDHNGSSLSIDLGETRTVSEVQIQWRFGGKGRDFDILTSEDGKNFTVAKAVTGNNDFVTTVAFDQPIETQYVKILCNTSNGSSYMIQEFLVIEEVDKTELDALLQQAEAALAEKGLAVGDAVTGADKELLDAVIWAKASRYNMQAKGAEVEDARLRLAEALGDSPTPGPASYQIQLPTAENGTVTSSSQTAKEGDTVTLTVTPDTGYTLKSITVSDASGTELQLTEGGNGQYSFTMPAGNVTVSAVFEKQGTAPASYQIQLSKAENGTIKASSETAKEGDTVTLTATPATGYVLKSITATDAKGAKLTLSEGGNGQYSFTMPAGNVTVSAVFEKQGTAPASYQIQLSQAENGTIKASSATAKEGDTVTLTATPATGYVLKSITAADARGAKLTLSEGGNGQYSFKMPGSNVTVSVVFEKEAGNTQPYRWPFSDVAVTPGAWKYESVKYVYDNNIMQGISGTDLFQPDHPLTRAMFATVLYRMAEEPAVTVDGRFSDVEPGKWYSEAIIWANEKGIVTGYTDGSYGINDFITREQIAKMLYEYADKVCKYNVSEQKALEEFTDADAVSHWAVDYMKWATAVEMITGKPNDAAQTSFRMDPKGQATRAECAAMLMRFQNKYKAQ